MERSKISGFLALFYGQGLNILVTFLFIPFLSRSLEIEQFGTYGQVLMIVEFVRAIFTAGLGKVIYSFYGNENYENGAVFKNNAIAGVVLGVLSIFTLALISPVISHSFKNNELTGLILVFSISIPFSIVYQSINSTLIFYGRSAVSAKLSVASNLIRLSLMLGTFLIYKSLYALFGAMVIGYVIQFLMGKWSIRNLFSSTYKFNVTLIKKQVLAGVPFGLISVVGVALVYSSGFIISFFEGTEKYALYRNGAFEVPFINTIYGSISMIMLPDVVRFYNQNEKNNIVLLKNKIILYTAIIIVPVVVFIFFFHKPIIILYLSDKYAESSIIFMIYSLILLVRVTSYEDIFIATGNSKFVLKANIFVLFVNIILTIILVAYFSIVGAAVSVVVTTFLIALLLLLETAKILECKVIDFFNFKKLGISALISIGISIFFYFVWLYFKLESIFVVLFFILYAIIVFICNTIFKQYELEILERLLFKIKIPNLVVQKISNLYNKL